MKRILLLTAFMQLLTAPFAGAQIFQTPFEKSKGAQTATYAELIDFYQQLDDKYETIKMQTAGGTDANYPLHVVYYSRDKEFAVNEWKRLGKVILLINNGIHPGEPDGIDASMMLMRDLAMGKVEIPEHVVLAVIPVFNIGGMLNRGSYSRANQNGPEAYGFRGSAQHLDLNRDFIKMDAKETRNLVQLFRSLDPDIFIDNHVSNGADYQHVMTLLTPNARKQGYYTGRFLKNSFEPRIYEMMKQQGYDLVPYVNHWGSTPDKGWQQFYEPPRFASGYAALFRTFAFVPETHMLKPYKQRVDATYALMKCFIYFAADKQEEIKRVREMEWQFMQERKEWTIDWKVDTTLHSEITFKGYEAKYKPSDVSGNPRLYYDKSMPYTKQVPFYDKYLPSKTAAAPQYYVLPKGWQDAVRWLEVNHVEMIPLTNDTLIALTVYRIKDYETSKKPYEGHYPHSNVQFEVKKEKVKLLKGDYLIPLQQKAKRYLVEVLEPDAPDAFFAWNFFDAILQQKEHFSDYVFEDEAAQYLKQHPELKSRLEEKRKSDTAFAGDGHAQLEFIYQNSPYLEPEYMRYPVFRID
ncbi:MAG TPA: M14 family metallopeptidase [Flavipsychrobacter sp.]|nr:M14 family metallopeptidase [Flavipsychrobacter sp.]